MKKHLFCLLLATTLVATAVLAHGVRLQIELTESEVLVVVSGEKFIIKREHPNTSVNLTVYSDERFSTATIGAPMDNWLKCLGLIARSLLSGTQSTSTSYSAPGHYDIFLFNPFRGRIEVREDEKSSFIGYNFPDSNFEFRAKSGEVDSRNFRPPFLYLSVTGLLLSLAAGCFMWVLAGLFGRRSDCSSESLPRCAGLGLKAAGFIALCAAIAAAYTTWIQQVTYYGLPAFGDEVNYLFQARIFQSGALAVPEPISPEFFRIDWTALFDEDKLVWNFHPFGNSLILLIGLYLGCHWITIPFVAALNIVVVATLAWKVFQSRRKAAFAALLLTSSHYFLTLSASLMAHAPSMLLTSCHLLFATVFIKQKLRSALYASFLFLGLAFITRPLSALLIGFVPCIAISLTAIRRKEVLPLFTGMLLFAFLGSLLFFYTYFITGEFTLAYLMKGMEKGVTLSSRLDWSWSYRLENLFRYANEFQHRVHSGGLLLNCSLFLIPLLGLRLNQSRRWLLCGYLIAGFYLIAHSALQWYGWKWEPRMLFSMLSVVIVISAEGLDSLCTTVSSKNRREWAFCAVIGAIAVYLFTYEIPLRLKTEYKDYNTDKSITRVSDFLHESKIEKAVIFFSEEKRFASYFAFNHVNFRSDIVFARTMGRNKDALLLAQKPDSLVFYDTPEGPPFKGKNFYRDFPRVLEKLNSLRGSQILVVIPWLKYADRSRIDLLPGKKLDEHEYLALLKQSIAEEVDLSGQVLTLVGPAKDTVQALRDVYDLEELANTEFETDVLIARIGQRNRSGKPQLPGFVLSCFDGTRWKGDPLSEHLVLSVDKSLCPESERSMTWITSLELGADAVSTLYLESDDGSGVFVNGELVLDNALRSEHGRLRETAAVNFKKGVNRVVVAYFNGPGKGEIEFGIVDHNGMNQPFSPQVLSSSSKITIPDAYLQAPASPADKPAYLALREWSGASEGLR